MNLMRFLGSTNLNIEAILLSLNFILSIRLSVFIKNYFVKQKEH